MASKGFDHKKIEAAVSKKWKEININKTESLNAGDSKFYSLYSFPYPSGSGLHVGHVEGMVANDIVARYYRMKGHNAMLPMGWDSFGLPAENYAIKTGIHPKDSTEEAINAFIDQIDKMGLMVDWEKEVGAHRPDYYKWTQWFFSKLYEHGLAYKAKAPVNWCPVDQTVLANEQVINGRSERSGALVEIKYLEQWFFRITDYADRLVDDLDSVDWPEATKGQQRNWIGRSTGAEMKFEIKVGEEVISRDEYSLDVFTTRPDTIFGATFMAVAPGHELVELYSDKISNLSEINTFVKDALKRQEEEAKEAQKSEDKYAPKEEKEKNGIKIEGISAINPFSGEEIPVFVADYILLGYGTGAIMAVPAHDERDFDFATKYGIEIKQVVAPYLEVEGEDAPRTDENIVVFDAATAIIKHWEEEDKYYAIEFKSKQLGFVGGTIEEGETELDTVVREIREESGFTDFEVEKKMFDAVSRGYKTRKKREEICNEAVFVVKLNSDKQEELEDEAVSSGKWMSTKEILNSKLLSHHKYYLEFYLGMHGKVVTEGVSINSNVLDGLAAPTDAKEKMVEEIEKNGIGKGASTYKLRDWLISRQRYWGAPIPVIWKERQEADKALIIHGFGGNSSENWFPWLADQIVENSDTTETIVPDFPNTDNPVLSEWLETIEGQELTEKSSITAHSLGCFAALKYAEKNKLKQLVMVAPTNKMPEAFVSWFKKEFSYFPTDEIYKNFMFEELDTEAIAKNVEEIVFVFSNNDPYITQEVAAKYKEQFGQFENVVIKTLIGKHHMGSNPQYTEIPEILEFYGKKQYRALKSDELPLELPMDVDFIPKGYSPLSRSEEYVQNVKNRFGQEWTPEFDTMDTFVCSSWYFFRFCDPKNENEFAGTEELNKWLPADLYMIGAEHIVLHLMYARFFTKFLKDIGKIEFSEPFQKMRHMGMIAGPDGRKMSKRWGNVINPNDVVEKYGADTLRVYEMFMGPLDQGKAWSDSSVQGVRRFLDRVYSLFKNYSDFPEESSETLEIEVNKLTKKITGDTAELKFNTAVAEFMKFLNYVEKDGISKSAAKTLVLLMAPYAPFITEDIYQNILGMSESVHLAKWPEYNEELISAQQITIGVQVTGKRRGEIQIAPDATEEDALEAAKNNPAISKYLQGDIKKVIYIKGKILNIIV